MKHNFVGTPPTCSRCGEHPNRDTETQCVEPGLIFLQDVKNLTGELCTAIARNEAGKDVDVPAVISLTEKLHSTIDNMRERIEKQNEKRNDPKARSGS